MPRLTLEEVDHIALLSRLRLTEAERTTLQDDLNLILEQFEILQQLDVEAVLPTTHAMALHNVFREDQEMPSLPREELLEQAPESRYEYFVAPRVIETDD